MLNNPVGQSAASPITLTHLTSLIHATPKQGLDAGTVAATVIPLFGSIVAERENNRFNKLLGNAQQLATATQGLQGQVQVLTQQATTTNNKIITNNNDINALSIAVMNGTVLNLTPESVAAIEGRNPFTHSLYSWVINKAQTAEDNRQSLLNLIAAIEDDTLDLMDAEDLQTILDPTIRTLFEKVIYSIRTQKEKATNAVIALTDANETIRLKDQSIQQKDQQIQQKDVELQQRKEELEQLANAHSNLEARVRELENGATFQSLSLMIADLNTRFQTMQLEINTLKEKEVKFESEKGALNEVNAKLTAKITELESELFNRTHFTTENSDKKAAESDDEYDIVVNEKDHNSSLVDSDLADAFSDIEESDN